MNPHRILFVDDEELLRQLYAEVGSHLEDYEVHCVGSAEAGIELLNRFSFDIVVTDLSMPGMSGVEFLAHVVKLQPDSARIIISAYADRLKLAECFSVGHRYLAKPVEIDLLLDLIKRLTRYRSLISNPKVRALIGGTGSLPSPPDQYVKISGILSSPYASLDEVAAELEKDVSITARILQIVNSAHFGLAQKVVSLREAIQFTGVYFVRDLLLAIQTFSTFYKDPRIQPLPPAIWDHSIRIGLLARQLGRAFHLSQQACEQAFLAGLLHDVGKILLMSKARSVYDSVLQSAERFQIPIVEAEQRLLGTTHPQLGAYLLSLWGLPEEVVECVEYHHSPESFPDATRIAPLILIHIAQALDPVSPRETALNQPFLASLSFESDIAKLKQLLAYDT